MAEDTLEQQLEDDTPPEEIDVQDVPVEPPQVPAGSMMLRMPRLIPYEEGFEFVEGNLNFGPGVKHAAPSPYGNIVFHAEYGGDGYATVVEIDPLLDALFRKYPQVEVVDSNPEPEAFVCEHCERDFKTKRGLLNHKRSHST